MISAKTSQFLAGCSFHLSLHPLDHVYRVVLGRKKNEPNVYAEVIDHQQKILLAYWCRKSDGTAEVSSSAYVDLYSTRSGNGAQWCFLTRQPL
jgi:hypothetical protein